MVAVVAAADIVAGLCELVGLIFLVVPGLFAAIRFAVAAPVAAIEHVSWPDAIRRSIQLTRGNFWRVLGVLAIQGVLTYLVALILDGRGLAATLSGPYWRSSASRSARCSSTFFTSTSTPASSLP